MMDAPKKSLPLRNCNVLVIHKLQTHSNARQKKNLSHCHLRNYVLQGSRHRYAWKPIINIMVHTSAKYGCNYYKQFFVFKIMNFTMFAFSSSTKMPRRDQEKIMVLVNHKTNLALTRIGMLPHMNQINKQNFFKVSSLQNLRSTIK